MKCPNCNHEITVYRNPIPTVDIIIEREGKIILVKRKNPPFGWAIPGGFVDYGESFETAAAREAKEECSVTLTSLQQFHTYSDPHRDPRMHTATTVFIATAEGTPVAADDAAELAFFTRDTLPEEIPFDHREILTDYFQSRKGKGDG